MPRVNLLPWREERRRRRQRQFLAVLCFTILAGGAAALAARLAVQGLLAEQRDRNRTILNEIELLDVQLAELAQLEIRRNHLLARLKILVELRHARPLAVRMFDELVEVVPAGVQLVEVARNGDRIVLDGLAESSGRVAALMRNIDASQWFLTPRLEVVEVDPEGAVKRARFTISMEQAASLRDP